MSTSTLATLTLSLGGFLAGYGLGAIAAVMLLKEAGVPLPVPSDLIMLTAGIQAAAGAYSPAALLLVIELAVVAGGSLQFLVACGIGRRVVYRFGRWVGLTPARLDQAAARIRGRGALAIVIGLNVPGARAGIIPAAGLAGLRYRTVLPAMMTGSTLFYGWHIALGYLVGPPAIHLLARLHLPLGWMLLGLAALGLGAWLALRLRKAAGASGSGTLARVRAWTEAACPVCLAATAAQRLAPHVVDAPLQTSPATPPE